MASPITFDVARSAPRGAAALAIPVATDGPVPKALGIDRTGLATLGFNGELGQSLVVPLVNDNGAGASIAVGVGARQELTTARLRTAAATAARALKQATTLAFILPDGNGLDPEAAGQSVAEGVTLATYRYTALKTE